MFTAHLPVPDDVHRFHYRLAGLDIASDLELLEGHPARSGVRLDDELVIASGARLGLSPPQGGNARSRDGRRVRLVVPGIGRFHLDDGRRVIAWPEPDATTESLSQGLTGTVLALVMMQRDILVLHGSVIVFGDRAVIVVGHSGDGKSTTAAACARHGYAVLSDDLAPIDIAERVVSVRPTCGIVRVSDDASLALPDAPHWKAAGKTAVRVDSTTYDAPIPVSAILQLDVAEAIDVRPLSGTAAVLTLLEHAYCRPAFQVTHAAWAMAQCERIVSRCPVVTLSRPKRLDVLDDVVSCLRQLTMTDV